jgi:large subunit ribosomal protein L1
MATEIENLLKNALAELRKDPNANKKFNQTVDLLINLQKFDIKKSNVNLFVSIPHKIKEKKIAGFLEIKNKNLDTITLDEFKKYSDKKETKKLVKKYDFFIAQASLMPKVATTFGRGLGPTGKMPSPQLGILMNADEKAIKEIIEKVNNSVKIRAKEASIKLAIGKQNMSDSDLIENILMVYNSVLKALPKERDNIKNIEIKFTMTKPVKIKIR